MKELINNYLGVLLPVLKYLNWYIPKPTMGAVYHFKVPSSDSMTRSENFRFNPNVVNIYLPNMISCMPLAESST